MSDIGIINHVITATSTAVGTATCFGIVMRIMWQKIAENHGLLKKRLDDHEKEANGKFDKLAVEKKDKDLCEMEHEQVDRDLDDGRSKFNSILARQDRTTEEVRALVTQSALIAVKLEAVLPRIDKLYENLIKSESKA